MFADFVDNNTKMTQVGFPTGLVFGNETKALYHDIILSKLAIKMEENRKCKKLLLNVGI